MNIKLEQSRCDVFYKQQNIYIINSTVQLLNQEEETAFTSAKNHQYHSNSNSLDSTWPWILVVTILNVRLNVMLQTRHLIWHSLLMPGWIQMGDVSICISNLTTVTTPGKKRLDGTYYLGNLNGFHHHSVLQILDVRFSC